MLVGKTLSNFEITALIGRGGMGEVYRAQDRKLSREVAIKVLPQEFARDPDRVARFQREAKLLASLNHPNIASIHGLEESGGTQFLVLELVEGETLAQRVKRGPIPVEESLKLALQISEALEAAHEKGVIHRDLKPANIKVTPEGKVKVLDFGLAKAFAGEQADLNLSNSPTLSLAATQQGVILGTAAYMSPEQAKGKDVDKRADVWAFGCVLFEMLTGRSLFSADDISQTLARVLERQPDFSTLPPNLHPKLIDMLERCLEKDARNRCHDIADVRLDIEKILADPEGVLVQKAAAEEQRTSMRRMLPWLAATLILTAVVAGAAVWYLKPAPELKGPLITRFPLEADGFGVNHGMALSADGSKLVYAADKDGVRQLFLRARDQMAAVPIRDTKDAVHPFFSPDGNWVGFFNGTEIKKVSLSGGLAQTLCKAGDRYGASWGPDGTIVFSTSDSPGLMRVSASGGEPKPLTKPDTGSGWHHWPEFMPDGKAVLFTILKGPSDWQVAVLSLKTNTSRVLISGTDAHFASSGHLVFAREGSLWAVPFDSSRLELKGESVPIVEDVRVNTGGWAHYGLANDGSLVYLPGTTQTLASRLTWVDRKGKEEPIAAPSNQYGWPRISPDGTRLALGVRDTSGNYDIWTWEFARGTLTQLTFDAKSSNPLWTPDGKRIVFRSSRDGNPAVYWKAADGTGEDEKLGSVPNRVLIPYSWSGNGKTLVSIESAGGKADIVALSMEGDRARKVLLHEKHSETSPQASPDGQWLAYVSDESGPYKVYVRPFPEVNKGKWPISISGGDWPIWSRDGRELFYRSGDAIMALAVKTEPTFTAGKPEVLFKGVINPWNESSSLNFWDISPDGKRFLLVRSVESDAGASAAATPAKINVVLNFFEELKQKAP